MTSRLDAQVADILLRSRATILDILEDRGYNTEAVRNIAPDQILTLAEANPRSLDIFIPKREGSAAPAERAVVVYQIQDRIRMRLAGSFKDDLFGSYDGTASREITPADDIIVLLNEPPNEAFAKFSLRLWQTEKIRLTFFHIKEVVVHLGRHVLVPPHRKMTAEELKADMERLHVSQKSQMPVIKHSDMQARLLGLVPGDGVEILRPSPTAGVERFIRVCAA
jgi:DNA-directed RNA polymerase subunit H (RpoH/RPB5)